MERTWWVWVCWIEQQNVATFIYGCAAQADRSPEWKAHPVCLKLPNGSVMIIKQCTADDAAMFLFKEGLQSQRIALKVLLDEDAPETEVLAQITDIHNFLGHTAYIDCYCTLPELREFVLSYETFDMILATLKENLNVDFTSDYAHHLGNFEIINPQDWLERPEPFSLEVSQNDENNTILEFHRDQAFAQAQHVAHLIGWANGYRMFDTLCYLEPNALRKRLFALNGPLDKVAIWLFSDDAERQLVYSDELTFLREINIEYAIMGKQVTIIDKLTIKAKNKGPLLERRASKIQSHTKHSSKVEFFGGDLLRTYMHKIKRFTRGAVSSQIEDDWLAPSIESEVEVIERLNTILQDRMVKSAILVDPWFGVEALQKLIPRLTSQDLQLTILTSITAVDPDSNQQISSNEVLKRVRTSLENLKAFINPALKITSVVNGDKKAMHDRYLLLYKYEETMSVYLLSNSINKMAGRWPFCISLLSPTASGKIQLYVEGLLKGDDITGATTPRINFSWPEVNKDVS